MQHDDHENDVPDQSDFDLMARLEAPHRESLAKLPPAAAQADVDRVLMPQFWRLVDPDGLAWPGDLADDLEDLDDIEDLDDLGNGEREHPSGRS
jgi:hypothetical protein